MRHGRRIRAYMGVVRNKQNMFCAHETTAIYCGPVPKGIYGESLKQHRSAAASHKTYFKSAGTGTLSL